MKRTVALALLSFGMPAFDVGDPDEDIAQTEAFLPEGGRPSHKDLAKPPVFPYHRRNIIEEGLLWQRKAARWYVYPAARN